MQPTYVSDCSSAPNNFLKKFLAWLLVPFSNFVKYFVWLKVLGYEKVTWWQIWYIKWLIDDFFLFFCSSVIPAISDVFLFHTLQNECLCWTKLHISLKTDGITGFVVHFWVSVRFYLFQVFRTSQHLRRLH